jgi:alpha-D-xyloside xylohydrolase
MRLFCWSPGSGKAAWGAPVNTPDGSPTALATRNGRTAPIALVVDDEALDLFLISGRDPGEVLDHTSHLGRAPDVPVGIGGGSPKPTIERPGEAIAVAAKLRARRIPCDVLTFDGRAAWDVQTRFDFHWDPQRFRDPSSVLAKIKANSLSVCLWEYPYVSVHSPLFQELADKEYLLKTANGDPYVFGWDTSSETSPFGDVLTALPESGLLDFTNPAAYVWWREAHRSLFEAGVDVIMSDFGERPGRRGRVQWRSGKRLHNVYPLLYNRCVYEATKKFGSQDSLPMVWSRAGWTGSQRYPIQWGGDPQSDWEGLAASIRGGLSWGMSGVPYHASDIGGFYGSVQPSAELYLRWLQMSVFSSHMRVHGIGAREPWAFGDENEAIARQWIEFRYRLLPYLQSVIARAIATGLPVLRAMPLAFPTTALTRSFETQFMCGDALLVAPIVAAGGEVEIALPPGAWYDLSSRQRVAGRQVIRYRATLDRFPVFGREGYALPLGPVVQHTGEIDKAKPLDALWLFGTPSHAPKASCRRLDRRRTPTSVRDAGGQGGDLR